MSDKSLDSVTLEGAYQRTDRARQRVSFTSPSGDASTQHVGEWLSLVEHLVRDQGVGGSNPLSPTILLF